MSLSSNTAPVVEPAQTHFMDAPSFKGKLWTLPVLDHALAQAMAQRYQLPELAAQLLILRGVGMDDVESFLKPRMKDHFPDPCSLVGMKEAAADVAAAIIAGQRVGVLADFDVDGATSSAIFRRFLKSVTGEEAPLYIPDRLTEGYGPNEQSFEWFKEQSCDWVVIVDSGTTSFKPVQHATDLKIKTVIIDHHEAEDTLPNATHIINPKRKDDTSGLDMLAACGVTFLFAVAVNAALRDAGFYEGKQAPDLRSSLDLVALGTVCDMVPMIGANRLFVKAGFAKMEARDNVGIDALLTMGKVDKVPDPYHAGFVIGPRINAGSRVHQSDLGAKLLATEDPEEARAIAYLLDDCNVKRRSMQKEMMAHAAARVQAFGFENDAAILLDDKDWHPGLVGLVAGEIKERFGKPTCIVAYAENEDGVLEGRGSGRSVPGINIAEAFIEARNRDIIIKGGGHAMAGGFTILPERLDDFRTFLKEFIGAQAQNLPAHPEMNIDGVMSVRSVTIDLAKLIDGDVAPYGAGHPEPTFILKDVSVLYADVVGANHVRCTLRDKDGGPTIKAVAFRALETPLGKFLMREAKDNPNPVHLVGSVKVNSWQGRESAEFHIADGYAGFAAPIAAG